MKQAGSSWPFLASLDAVLFFVADGANLHAFLTLPDLTLKLVKPSVVREYVSSRCGCDATFLEFLNHYQIVLDRHIRYGAVVGLISLLCNFSAYIHNSLGCNE